MKIARVFIAEYSGKQVGDIHDVFDPASHPGSLLSGTLLEVEVDDEFDKEIQSAAIYNTKWSKEGEDDVYVDPEDEEWSASSGVFVVFSEDPDKVAAKVVKDKTAEITERYNDMNADVYGEMATVFGTQNPESATAWHQTWGLMKTQPSLYFNLGWKVHVAHGTFSVGDALDTIQKVEDYADAAIAAVSEYSVSRMTRIKQFYDEKAAIEGA